MTKTRRPGSATTGSASVPNPLASRDQNQRPVATPKSNAVTPIVTPCHTPAAVTFLRIDGHIADLVLVDHPVDRSSGALRSGQPAQHEPADQRHEHDDARQFPPAMTQLCTRQRERCLHPSIRPRHHAPDKDAGVTCDGVLAPRRTHRSVTSPPRNPIRTFEA